MSSIRCALCVAWLCLLLVSCGGGGGPGSQGGPDFDFGLVSGAQATDHAVEVLNPLEVPAQVRVAGNSPSFAFVASSLPSDAVPVGGAFACDVRISPSGPGEMQGGLSLEFYGSGTSTVVSYAARAMAEDVRVTTIPAVVDFGTPTFGGSVDKILQLHNASTVSRVTFDAATFPSADFSVVGPAMPFTLNPGGGVTVTLRCRPIRSIDAVNGAATLHASGPDGSVPFSVRVAPVAGTAVVDLGLHDFTGGLTKIFSVYVPPKVWALHVETWREGLPVPDYYTGSPSPDLPDPNAELISLALFEDPSGGAHHLGWWPANGSFAAGLPRSHLSVDQVTPGGGTWRFQFAMTDPPPGPVPARVRVVMKATATGEPPPSGTLDLNLWIDTVTGVFAATAPSDFALQQGLAHFDQILRQQGMQLGDVAYYEWDSSTGGSPATEVTRLAALRAVIPRTPGIVQDRLNLFVGYASGSSGGRTPGCGVAWSNHSFAMADYRGDLTFLIPHEVLHHLGLWHVGERPMDVQVGGLPANVMDYAFLQSGNTISPGQGLVVRGHPFLR